MHSVYTVNIPSTDGRLGRHVEHDSRSLAYAYQGNGADTPIKWVSHLPCFDQGNLGSCTGNASTGVLTYDPFFVTVPSNVILNEDMCVKVYSAATGLDSIKGAFPPKDTGSTSLGASKALTQLGLISGYQMVRSIPDLISALHKTPVMIGSYWYNAMFHPDSNGLVNADPSSGIAGGHEYVCDEYTGTQFGFRNSWGASFGVQGRFYVSVDQFTALLGQDGDAMVFTPTTSPAPVPNPVPVPPTPSVDQNVLAAYNSLKTWAKANNIA